MIVALSDFYLPKSVPHRETETKQIRDIFNSFKKYQSGVNTAVLGVTGSGKTTMVKKVKEEEDVDSVYINCAETKTSFNTLKQIFNLKIKTHSTLLIKTIEKLKEEPKILIFDEVDKLKDFLLFCADLNVIYRKTLMPIIIITLKRKVLDDMPTDVRKTLFFDRLNLRAYNAIELKDILKARISEIDIEIPKINDGVLSFISAISAKQGSARMLINLILRCIQCDNFTQKFISGIYNELIKNDWVDFTQDLNETEKNFLGVLLDSCTWEKEVTSGQLQNKIGVSGGRISQLINIFEKYSAVISRHENLGRVGGRRRFIKFATKEIYDELILRGGV